MSVQLVAITPENWRQFTALKIADRQRGHVADNVLMLARAYVYRNEGGQAWGICHADQPIGLLVQRAYQAAGRHYCCLDQLMIAAAFQGQGYGTASLSLWLEQVRQQGVFDAVVLCYLGGSQETLRFYQRFGFVHNGMDYENEIGLELDLRATPAGVH